VLIRLDIQGLSLSRGERRLFSDLSFALSAGEAAALTGANGAGKTSLLRAVAGFIRPDAGTVVFHDADGEIEAETARRAALHLLGHHEGLKPSARRGRSWAFRSNGWAVRPPPWTRPSSG